MKFSCRNNALIIQNVLDVPPFSEAQCDALFAAVLVHDDIDLDAQLPEVIHLDYSQEQLTQCYRICRQVWKQGVNRKYLCKLVEKLLLFCTIAQEERHSYHNVRAKIKHLRFAYVTFDERHAYPVHLHRMTRIMGELQDAFKNKQKATIRNLAIKLRFLLTMLPYALVTKEIDQFQPSTIESFRKYVNDEINFIRLH